MGLQGSTILNIAVGVTVGLLLAGLVARVL
jgi:hypothetical protein